MSSYKSFFNPTNVLVVMALLALILFRHSLFPEATESHEVKQLMGKMDAVIDDMQKVDAEPAQTPITTNIKKAERPETPIAENTQDEDNTSKMVTEKSEQQEASDEPDAQSILTLWQTARRAAWDGNSDAAVENYRALIKLQPDNYDAYGEMGNVLLQKGENESAVEAYSKASLLLAKSGYPQAAWHVANIVTQIDKAKAEKLRQTLYGAPDPANQ